MVAGIIIGIVLPLVLMKWGKIRTPEGPHSIYYLLPWVLGGQMLGITIGLIAESL